jgi:two-component system sensor histidine kinase EvgS
VNVLLVDDERLALGVMAGGLRTRGIAVTEASSASQALALWQEHSFDVLLTDIAMPGMTGLELAHQINRITSESPDRARGRMVALTGNYARSAEDLELTQVFDRILCKPITAGDVARALKTLADQGPRSR